MERLYDSSDGYATLYVLIFLINNRLRLKKSRILVSDKTIVT
jgi:hypothetical protein